MRLLKALFLSALLAMSFAASATTSTIKVLVVITPRALSGLGSTAAAALTTQATAEINTALTNSGITDVVVVAGSSSITTVSGFTGSQQTIEDARDEAIGSVYVAQARDAAGADQVIVIDTPPIPLPNGAQTTAGVSGGIQTGPYGSVAVVDARYMNDSTGASNYVAAHEWCHLMGCVHVTNVELPSWYANLPALTYPNNMAYAYRAGSTQSDCDSSWTLDQTTPGQAFSEYSYTVGSACWFLDGSSSHLCWASGHATMQEEVNNIQATHFCIPPNGPTYSGGTWPDSPTDHHWDEMISCTNWGFATFHAHFDHTQTTTVDFQCTRAGTGRQPMFSNTNVLTATGHAAGGPNNNDAAQIRAYAPTAATLHNTSTTPGAKMLQWLFILAQ